MKHQSELLVITSGLMSIVTSSLLIVFLVSLMAPDQFHGVPLAGNLQFLETEIETQLDLYSISSPVPVSTISFIIQLVLISTCSMFIIESLFLISGVKSKVRVFSRDSDLRNSSVSPFVCLSVCLFVCLLAISLVYVRPSGLAPSLSSSC